MNALTIVNNVMGPLHAQVKQFLPLGASIMKPVVPHLKQIFVSTDFPNTTQHNNAPKIILKIIIF